MKDSEVFCPVAATLDLIGGKYKALIIWHLADETLRFNELKDLLPNVTAKMLTTKLRELEHDKLLVRTEYCCVPQKVEYHLTDLGKSIKPILEALHNWGMNHINN